MKVVLAAFAAVMAAAVLAMSGTAQASAAAQAPTNSTQAIAILYQIERLAKRGQLVAVRYRTNPCRAIPAERWIINRIDSLLWKVRMMGYPSRGAERANDRARISLARIIGLCR
jgi:hypothetical protein